MPSWYASQSPQQAIVQGDGTRHCNWCGAHIDPIDWCPGCQTAQAPCNNPHRRLRKRADAAFCDATCRSAYHNDRTGSVGARRPSTWA